MTSFTEKLNDAMGPRGYESCMRRSVQTVVLYEAYRCISDRLSSLRPFQRKLAFYDQALALVDAIGLLPHQKGEIMWRTGTSKEPMQPETAWKRMKLIEKEVEKMKEKMKPFVAEGRSQKETCDMFVQQQYEEVSGQKDKPHPPQWSHSHNNVIFCYFMYFKEGELDPDFPAPVPLKEIVVPAEKPRTGSKPYYFAVNGDEGADNAGERPSPKHDYGSAPAGNAEDPLDRRSVLQEVREHLDLLKEFEGVISQEELNRRKRDLFMALPAAPPPAGSRKSVAPESPVKKPRRGEEVI